MTAQTIATITACCYTAAAIGVCVGIVAWMDSRAAKRREQRQVAALLWKVAGRL